MMLNPEILKSVCFIGLEKDGRFQPRATAFFVVWEQGDLSFRYLITAEHVIERARRSGQTVFVRLNLKDGSAQHVPLDLEAFFFHPDNAHTATDVAASLVRKRADDDALSIGLNGRLGMAATEDVIRDAKIGVGDEVTILGLFSHHGGRKRNIPVVRTGNLAALREEPLRGGDGRDIEGYLVEARSIGGLSGSPVFVSLPELSMLKLAQEGKGHLRRRYLLGLIHAHYDTPAIDPALDEEARGVGVNSGMSIVVPTSKIIETIDQPAARAHREAIAEAIHAGQPRASAGGPHRDV